MKRRVHTIWAILTSLMTALAGCRPQQPFYLREDGDLSHYLDVATEIEYPDVETSTLADVTESLPPYTLENANFKSYWDLTLEEAIQTSLCNSKVFRSLGGRFVSSAFNNRTQTGEAPDSITLAPDQVRTIYDPAIAETGTGTSGAAPLGVEAALAAFDAQWSTNFFYSHNDRQQNVLPMIPITDFFRQVFIQNTSTFNTQLQKITATGGVFTVRNNIVYDLNNNPTRQVPKDWNVNYEFAFNQPLLAGAGAEFNRIAGPFNPFVNILNGGAGGAPTSTSFDGVVLARINVDISLADFEGAVRNLVNDVEQAYWELSFAYRNLETANTALNSARQTWQKINVLYQIGTRGGEAKEEAQAREQFYQFKSQAQTLYNELFRAEKRLRYVMGIATTDGRLIRPMDRPSLAKLDFEWREILLETMARNLDLRRAKWRIKQRELELVAAKNQLLPRVDLNGTYRWLGLGDNLFGTRDVEFSPSDPFGLTGSSALQTLASGQFQEWQLGAQASIPIGFRYALNQVRHFQLLLARERARLQDEELEISFQLADAVQQLELNYGLTQTNFNRTLAADEQVLALQAAFEAQTVTLDQLLEAQRRRAEAQTSFFRTLLDYQRAVVTLHFRKGSLLEYNNVYLQEGPWPEKAQFDAHRLARQRDAGVYLNYGFTRPDVISQGAVRQTRDGGPPLHGEPGSLPDATNAAPVPEELPTPAPQETLPEPSAGPYSSSSGRPRNSGTPASGTELARRFEWGPLGTGAQSEAPQDDTWSRIVGKAEPAAPRPTRSALVPAVPADGGRGAAMQGAEAQKTTAMRDLSVRRAGHRETQQEPKRTPRYESFSNQSPRATLGPAASGQRP